MSVFFIQKLSGPGLSKMKSMPAPGRHVLAVHQPLLGAPLASARARPKGDLRPPATETRRAPRRRWRPTCRRLICWLFLHPARAAERDRARARARERRATTAADDSRRERIIKSCPPQTDPWRPGACSSPAPRSSPPPSPKRCGRRRDADRLRDDRPRCPASWQPVDDALARLDQYAWVTSRAHGGWVHARRLDARGVPRGASARPAPARACASPPSGPESASRSPRAAAPRGRCDPRRSGAPRRAPRRCSRPAPPRRGLRPGRARRRWGRAPSCRGGELRRRSRRRRGARARRRRASRGPPRTPRASRRAEREPNRRWAP